jgi:expansin
VIDQCPECATGHIDLSEPAFAKLAPLSAGLINVTYTYLTDPALPGPISIEVKQGSSQYWLALLADNTGNPLASVQVETPSGWLSLARASYNYWIAQSGAGQGPFTVRLTDTQGHQATVSGITLSPGAVQSTGTWMYGAGSAPAPAPSAPAPSAPAPSAAASAPSSPRAPAASSSAASSPAGTSPSRPSPTGPTPPSSLSPAPAVARTSVRSSSRQRPQAAPASPPVPSAPAPSPRSTC